MTEKEIQMASEIVELVLLVQSMREAQKRYFRERGQEALRLALGLERDVDDLVAELMSPEPPEAKGEQLYMLFADAGMNSGT